ncbi:MAG: hypothetical protein ACRED0_05925 [Gammaproteobacteria bacterium]
MDYRFMGAKAMTNIFSRIKKELASWLAIWRFLLALDRNGLNFTMAFTEIRPEDGVDKGDPEITN